MSSHREAPGISKDPAADSTDVYAFVDPNDATKAVLIANYIPFEIPYGGPNFSEFADDVTYAIHVSNKGTSQQDITYEFRFGTVIRNASFLYNTGPIGSASSANWNRPQKYSVTKVVRNSDGSKTSKVVASNLRVPPCNVGARSTPDYDATFTQAAVHDIGGGVSVFAGQRADAFKVDLGSIFDLGGIRELNTAHAYKLMPNMNMAGVNGLSGLNVHTIALSVPIKQLTKDGKTPASSTAGDAVIGIWTSAHRARSQVYSSKTGTRVPMGGPVQVSRLGNPLFNEVINPMGEKDYWNAMQPYNDKAYAKYVLKPELAGLLPVLYPGVFPNLANYKKQRIDLAAVLLTGVPPGIVSKTFTTYTGSVEADMLRLNLGIAAVAPGDNGYSEFGVLGNDVGGFPNGRRIGDDVTAIELRAIAGATIPLVDTSYTPDAAAMTLVDYSENAYYTNPKVPSGADAPTTFPFMPAPNSGYATTPPLGSTGGTSGTQGAPNNPGTGG